MASLVNILSNIFAPQQSTPAISVPAISTTTSSNPFSNNPFVNYNGNRFSSATYAKNQPVKGGSLPATTTANKILSDKDCLSKFNYYFH